MAKPVFKMSYRFRQLVTDPALLGEPFAEFVCLRDGTTVRFSQASLQPLIEKELCGFRKYLSSKARGNLIELRAAERAFAALPPSDHAAARPRRTANSNA